MASTQLTSSPQSSSLQRQAIDNARSAFSQLPHSDQAFQACVSQAQTIPGVVEFLAQQHRRYTRKRLARLLEKFQRHTVWLQKMSGAVDIVVQANAGIGCPLWAPIKYVLLVSNDHAGAAEGILKVIETISGILPHPETYLKLQPHPSLDAPLLNVFTDVVEFSVQAIQYFGMSSIERLTSLMRLSCKERFGGIMDRLRKHSRDADESAKAIGVLRNDEIRKGKVHGTISNLNLAKKWVGATVESQRGDGLMIRCQEWLRPLDVKAIHQSQRQSRSEGTCTWVWTNPDFLRWRVQPSSQESDRVLCIYGPPGCGKSVLASSIAEGFQVKQFPTLFYSFSGMDADRQSISGLIRTFLWQLIQDTSDERRLDIVLNLMRNGSPGIDELWNAFKEVVALVPGQVYCIIDGTDECSDPTSILLDRICELLTARESTNAILMGRPQDLQSALATTPTAMAIEISPEIIKHDIDKFIDSKIQESTIPSLPGDLGDTVSQTLKSNSDGMFLWAKLMINELSRSSTPFHVKEILRNLPRGLEETYRHLLLQLTKRLNHLNLDLARRVLALTSVARRTLDLKEVQCMCALNSLPSSTDSNPGGHLLLHPEKDISEVCGDFISIRDGLVRFAHLSVREFLTRPESEWSGDDDRQIASFRVDVESEHQNLGSTCLDFLATGDYAHTPGDGSYEGAMARYPLLKYASVYMISHLSQFGTPCPATLARLWDFIQSEKCATWIEYAGVIHMGSSTFEMLLEDHLRISQWPGSEQLVCLPALIRQELARRVREFGEHDPCTDRWRVIVDAFRHLKSSLPIPQPEGTTPTTVTEPRPLPGGMPQDLADIIDGLGSNLMLPLERQVNMVLKLQSYLSQVNALTDPLNMLPDMIRQNASAIPIDGPTAIADITQKVNKLAEELEVGSTPLKKTEGREGHTSCCILNWIGGILERRRKRKNAKRACRRALKEGEKILGVENLTALASANSLAKAIHSQERFAKAEVLHRRTLTRREKVLGADHFDTLLAANSLANALYSQDKFSEAEPLYRRALAGGEKLRGANHRNTLLFADNLGLALCGQGKPAEAEVLHRRALTGRDRVLGADHSETLLAANNLANALYSQDKLSEAETLYRRALAGGEKVLGANHRNTLLFADNLGLALCGQGKPAEAEVLHRRALTSRDRVLGADHPHALLAANNLAHALYSQDKFSEAEPLFRRALAGGEKVLGANHRNTLLFADNLGLALCGQGKPAEAEVLHRRALTGRDRVLGADHPDALLAANNLACALYSQDKFSEAESLYRRALAGGEKVLGANHRNTLLFADNLGLALWGQGKPAEAEVLHRRALTGRDRVLGADHPDALLAANNLAHALYSQDKFSEAEPLLLRALAGGEKVLGANHRNTLLFADNLGLALCGQGKPAEAEVLHRRALTGRDRVLGAYHPDALLAANNLACALDSQDKFSEAESLFRRALAGGEKVLGANHRNTLLFADNLGLALRGQGKPAEAEVLHRRALTGRDRVLGADHPGALLAANNLACALYSQDKFSEAESLYRRALAGGEKVLGVNHRNTLLFADNLGLALCGQGKPAEAEVLHRRALTGRDRVLGADHPDALLAASSLALVLYNQDKFAEAEVLYRRALAGREKALGVNHLDTLASANSLARVLYRKGKFAEAEVLHRRALTGREKVLGADHPDTLASKKSPARALYSQFKLTGAKALSQRTLTGEEEVLGRGATTP